MIFSICLIFIILFSFLFPLFTQPFSMASFLVVLAGVLSVSFSVWFSSWVAMIMFLIFVGGLLIMYMFVVSFTPNVTFIYFFFFIFLFLTSLFSFWKFSMVSNLGVEFMCSMEMDVLGPLFLEGSRFSVYIWLVMLLFSILIIVASICMTSRNTLRSFEYV